MLIIVLFAALASLYYLLSRHKWRNSLPRLKFIGKIIALGAAGLMLLRFGMPLLGIALSVGGIIISALQQWLQLQYLRKSWGTTAPTHNSGNMTPEQAYSILGITESAPKTEIIAAYRRLMAKNHPDQGGTEYIAQQINQAKDVLLSKPPI